MIETELDADFLGNYEAETGIEVAPEAGRYHACPADRLPARG